MKVDHGCGLPQREGARSLNGFPYCFIMALSKGSTFDQNFVQVTWERAPQQPPPHNAWHFNVVQDSMIWLSWRSMKLCCIQTWVPKRKSQVLFAYVTEWHLDMKFSISSDRVTKLLLWKRSSFKLKNVPVSHKTRAFWLHTQERFESTHGSVLKVHMGASRAVSSSHSLSPVYLSSHVCLSSHVHLSSHVSVSSHLFSYVFVSSVSLYLVKSFSFSAHASFFLSLSLSLVGSLFLCSMTMTMISRQVGYLCTHGSELPWVPECVGRGSFPVGRTCSHHARKNCLGILVQASCHLEWSGPVSVLEMEKCLKDVTVRCVFVRVGMHWFVMSCVVIVVVVVLLVASMLASMRWLLCGEKRGLTSMTVPKKKKRYLSQWINYSRKGCISITVLTNSQKYFRMNSQVWRFALIPKKSETEKSVIIFGVMALNWLSCVFFVLESCFHVGGVDFEILRLFRRDPRFPSVLNPLFILFSKFLTFESIFTPSTSTGLNTSVIFWSILSLGASAIFLLWDSVTGFWIDSW